MKSILNWIGGKSLLAEKIITKLPEHTCYVEPFVGAGWVFFRKTPSKVEVLNDKNGDLVAMYRCIQNHLEEFAKEFKWLLTSRELWNDFRSQMQSNGLTDIQRGARFYYLQRLSFGGKVGNRTYGTSTTHSRAINLLRIEEELSQVHIRFNQVQIENLDYHEIIRRYDRPHTLFYVDPPYWNCEDYYGKGLFGKDDFHILAAMLADLKGKFLLSLNDTPEVRKIFSAFKIESVPVRYSCAKGERPMAKEVFITNY
ncbi:MAG: DNA adenine methylase [Desulfarculales bacterium]|jgi:DNA adenine methylase|nr:DNA adenine methylase [Desulfarculales bacterium]